MTTQPLISSFGRRRGRRLRPGKQAVMDALLPSLQITLPLEGGGQGGGLELSIKDISDLWRQDPHLNLPPFRGKNYFLEIGFGGGEHLVHQALHHCDAGIIGCEPYINGIAALLKNIQDHKLRNVRIFPQDARLLIEKLPDACLDKVFILYPDPWPKARHHKRRLISKEFLDSLARVMKTGAELRLATDHEDYATWMLERLLVHPSFKWTAKTCDDWLTPPADWIPTRYEQKRLAGMPTYLNFVRA